MAKKNTVTKKKDNKKVVIEQDKRIPESLLVSFIQAFFSAKCVNVSGCILVNDSMVGQSLNQFGYNVWITSDIPDSIIKEEPGRQKTPTYRHYLKIFILLFYGVEIFKIKENELFIDTEDEKKFGYIERGLSKLGFVIK